LLPVIERTKQDLTTKTFKHQIEEEALEFDAIAVRIIPTDETPGATEAGVIYFFDNVLGDRREEELAQLRDGLRELQTQQP